MTLIYGAAVSAAFAFGGIVAGLLAILVVALLATLQVLANPEQR